MNESPRKRLSQIITNSSVLPSGEIRVNYLYLYSETPDGDLVVQRRQVIIKDLSVHFLFPKLSYVYY